MPYRILGILAGGKSRRFNRYSNTEYDKALIKINGKPLLIHIIENSLSYYSDVCLSVDTNTKKNKYEEILTKFDLKKEVSIIVDIKNNNKTHGVLKGISSLLLTHNKREIQLMTTDRPNIDIKLLRSLEVQPNSVSILVYQNGLFEPLLSLYGKNFDYNSISLKLPLNRGDVFFRQAEKLQLYNLSQIIEDNKLSKDFFLNLNYPQDYQSSVLKPRDTYIITKYKSIINRVNINGKLEPKELSIDEFHDTYNKFINNGEYYRAFLFSLYFKLENAIDSEIFTQNAKKALLGEYSYWKDKSLHFLELHALQDLVYYAPTEVTKDILKEIELLKKLMNIRSKKRK